MRIRRAAVRGLSLELVLWLAVSGCRGQETAPVVATSGRAGGCAAAPTMKLKAGVQNIGTLAFNPVFITELGRVALDDVGKHVGDQLKVFLVVATMDPVTTYAGRSSARQQTEHRRKRVAVASGP